MKTIKRLWFENERIFVEFVDGKVQSRPMLFFPRLRQATDKQRAEWTESYFGLHWKILTKILILRVLHGTTTYFEII